MVVGLQQPAVARSSPEPGIGEAAKAGGDGWKAMKSMPGQSWAGQLGSGGKLKPQETLGRDRLARRNTSKPVLPLVVPKGAVSSDEPTGCCSPRDDHWVGGKTAV